VVVLNLIDVLNLDLGSIEEEYHRVAASLAKIGLSDYESKSYVAMIAKGHATAEEVAELARVPRTSAYKALQSLKEKGFVSLAGGRPALYHAVPLEETRDKVVGEIREAFDKLQLVQGILSERGTPQLVYTISGRKGVMAKIGEMIDAARSSIVLSSPSMSEIRSEHGQRIRDAFKRGVNVLIVAEPSVKVPEATNLVRKRNLSATDVIIDGSVALIASPDLGLCGYSENPFIATHLENFVKAALESRTEEHEND